MTKLTTNSLTDRRQLLLSGATTILLLSCSTAAMSATLELEKDELKFGFIKLTDMAPLAIAYEKGYFEDEGLFVTLEPQANWKVLLDGVITGELDGAHMLAGQPLAATIGFGTKAHIVTPFSMDLNGNGITVSNEVWALMKPNVPIGADGKLVASDHGGRAEAGDRAVQGRRQAVQHGHGVPGLDPQLRAALLARRRRHQSGLLFARRHLRPDRRRRAAVGDAAAADAGDARGRHDQRLLRRRALEPGRRVQGHRRAGDHRLRDLEEQSGKGVRHHRRVRRSRIPTPRIALTKALIRAAKWLDENDNANRREAVEILARPEYVGADAAVIANSMTGTFEYEKGDKRDVPDFNVFFRYFATYPYYSDAVWYLTQMRRWGQIAEDKPDGWYDEIAKSVYRPDIYLEAAQTAGRRGQDRRRPTSPGTPTAIARRPPSSSTASDL